jgi:hypothetical protein
MKDQKNEGMVSGYLCDKVYTFWLLNSDNTAEKFIQRLEYMSDYRHSIEKKSANEIINGDRTTGDTYDEQSGNFLSYAVERIVGKHGVRYIIGLGRLDYVGGELWRTVC